MKRRVRRFATHLYGSHPCVIQREWKDSREILIIAGPRFGETRWVNINNLKEVQRERADQADYLLREW